MWSQYLTVVKIGLVWMRQWTTMREGQEDIIDSN